MNYMILCTVPLRLELFSDISFTQMYCKLEIFNELHQGKTFNFHSKKLERKIFYDTEREALK